MELNFAPMSTQMSILKIPQNSAAFVSSLWFTTHVGSTPPSAYCMVHRSTLFSSRKFRGLNLQPARCTSIHDISEEEDMKRVEELEGHPFDDINDEEINKKETSPAVDDGKGGEKGIGMTFSTQLLPSKFEFLDPEWPGIRLEPPSWPERDEVSRIIIEHKANSLEIPISLRIIKKKLRWKEGFVDAGEYVYCSVKKAFSSLVFIIRELQDQTWQLKENLNSEDLRAILNKMQGDMNLMFVWLFQQVFSKTPTLMVYVMILVANFSVHYMALQQPRYSQKAIAATMSFIEEENEEQSGIDKALRTQGGSIYKVPDDQMKQQLVTLESSDKSAETFRTNLMYQMCIDKEPKNLLLLINYARFLYLVAKDPDRAEEFFRRAIEIEPPDAEALGQYAYFLWLVRNDHWEAEEKYLQALDIDPNNTYHASNYAYFLWKTGAKDTCFPLSYDKVS